MKRRQKIGKAFWLESKASYGCSDEHLPKNSYIYKDSIISLLLFISKRNAYNQ